MLTSVTKMVLCYSYSIHDYIIPALNRRILLHVQNFQQSFRCIFDLNCLKFGLEIRTSFNEI